MKSLPPGSEQRQPKQHDIQRPQSVGRADSTARQHDRQRDREMDRITGCNPPKTVSIPLAQATRLLLDACQSNRAWLNDFGDDVIRVDADLYEVLLAYQNLTKHVA